MATLTNGDAVIEVEDEQTIEAMKAIGYRLSGAPKATTETAKKAPAKKAAPKNDEK